MAPWRDQGAIPVSALAFVTVALDDHSLVMVPVVMPAMMPIMMMTVLDHNGLGIGNRWCCDSNRADRGNDVSKFLHGVLLL